MSNLQSNEDKKLNSEINGVPAKSQFLQFYSQQSLAFFRLPAEKDSYCSCVIKVLKYKIIKILYYLYKYCFTK